MKERKPLNNEFEKINIDRRDYKLTNKQIALRIMDLGNFNKPYPDKKTGKILDEDNRLFRMCVISSYITDEEFLDQNIKFILPYFYFYSMSFYTNYVEFIEAIDKKILNSDLTKIKAISFSSFSKDAVLRIMYETPNYIIPELKIKFDNGIITTNFPIVEATALRNLDLEFINQIEELSTDEAIIALSEKIKSIRKFDYEFQNNISEERINFFRTMMEDIIAKSAFDKSQENNEINNPINSNNKNSFEKLLKNPNEEIFSNDFAFTLFNKMKEIYIKQNTLQADFSFLYDIMKKRGYIICRGPFFIKFLSLYNINITKIDSAKTGNPTKTSTFNSIEKGLRERHGLSTI